MNFLEIERGKDFVYCGVGHSAPFTAQGIRNA